jgi:hypothetical protein
VVDVLKVAWRCDAPGDPIVGYSDGEKERASNGADHVYTNVG